MPPRVRRVPKKQEQEQELGQDEDLRLRNFVCVVVVAAVCLLISNITAPPTMLPPNKVLSDAFNNIKTADMSSNANCAKASPTTLRHKVFLGAIDNLRQSDMFTSVHSNANVTIGEIYSDHHVSIEKQLDDITALYKAIQLQEESLIQPAQNILDELSLATNDNDIANKALQNYVTKLYITASQMNQQWMLLSSMLQDVRSSISMFRHFVDQHSRKWKHSVTGVSPLGAVRITIVREAVQNSTRALAIVDRISQSAKVEASAWYMVWAALRKIVEKHGATGDGSDGNNTVDPKLKGIIKWVVQRCLDVIDADFLQVK